MLHSKVRVIAEHPNYNGGFLHKEGVCIEYNSTYSTISFEDGCIRQIPTNWLKLLPNEEEIKKVETWRDRPPLL